MDQLHQAYWLKSTIPIGRANDGFDESDLKQYVSGQLNITPDLNGCSKLLMLRNRQNALSQCVTSILGDLLMACRPTIPIEHLLPLQVPFQFTVTNPETNESITVEVEEAELIFERGTIMLDCHNPHIPEGWAADSLKLLAEAIPYSFSCQDLVFPNPSPLICDITTAGGRTRKIYENGNETLTWPCSCKDDADCFACGGSGIRTAYETKVEL